MWDTSLHAGVWLYHVGNHSNYWSGVGSIDIADTLASVVKDWVTVVICWYLHLWCGWYNPGGRDVVLSQEAAYNLFDLGVNLLCFSLTQETAYNKVNLGVTSSYCYSLPWGLSAA